MQEQRPEVGSRAAGAAAQHEQAQSAMETVKLYSDTDSELKCCKLHYKMQHHAKANFKVAKYRTC